MKCYTRKIIQKWRYGASGRLKLQTISISDVTLNDIVWHRVCNSIQPVLACYTQQSLTIKKYELKTIGLFL